MKGKRAEVVKRRRDLRRLSEGLAPRHADSMPTLSEFVEDHFMPHYRGKHGVRSTYYADVLSDEGAILLALGDVRIDRITRERLDEFRRAREAEGRSPSTVRKNLTTIGTVLNYAVERRLPLRLTD